MNTAITIPAGTAANPGKVVETHCAGSTVFACVASNGEFGLIVDNDAPIRCNASSKFGQPGGRKFNRLTFANETAIPVDLVFYAGTQDFVATDVRNVVMVQTEETFQYSSLMNEDGSSLSVNAADPPATYLPATITVGGLTFQRISFHISNTADDLKIRHAKDDGTPGQTFDLVLANTDRTILSRDKVFLQGRSGTAVIAEYETYLSKPL